MTRKDLIAMANKIGENNWLKNTPTTKLTPKADIYHYSQYDCDIIQSYATIVAIFSRRTGSLYCFDTFSNTTVKHLYKAAKILKASRMVWLCERSDHAIETYIDGRSPFKGRRWEIDNLIKFGWSMEIETKWKFLNK